jgi:hypothetical protein
MEGERARRGPAERERQMSMLRRHALFVSTLVLAACGGSSPPAETPAAGNAASDEPAAAEKASPEADAAEKAAPTAGIPKECAKKGGTCVPPRGFVQKLCSGSFPSVGLYLFANKSPWARGYLRGRTKAWNASGGASDNGWLEFDEEVIILAERKADLGGMQVSGAGASYDALRWDGSCVTLSSEEVTLDKPPSPKSSKVEWRFLDDNVQESLRANEGVNKAYLVRRQECKGATSGDVSMKCVKADQKLSDEIVTYLRGGGSLPEPTKLP